MRYKSQENAVFIAIHPTTYRGGGFLAHGVLKRRLLKSSDLNLPSGPCKHPFTSKPESPTQKGRGNSQAKARQNHPPPRCPRRKCWSKGLSVQRMS